MTHPCENQCPNYNSEQCSTCLIQDEAEGIDLRDLMDEVVNEVCGGDE